MNQDNIPTDRQQQDLLSTQVNKEGKIVLVDATKGERRISSTCF